MVRDEATINDLEDQIKKFGLGPSVMAQQAHPLPSSGASHTGTGLCPSHSTSGPTPCL